MDNNPTQQNNKSGDKGWSNENRKLAIILGFIAFSIIMAFFIWAVCNNVNVSVKVKDAELAITSKSVEGQLKDYIEKRDKSLEKLKGYLNQDIVRELKDSISKLIYKEQILRNEAESLYKELQNYPNLSVEKRKDIIQRSVNFIATSKNDPNSEAITENIIGKNEVEKYKDSMGYYRKDKAKLERELANALIDKKKAEALYIAIKNEIVKLRDMINEYQKDSTQNAKNINKLTNQKASLETIANSLQSTIDSAVGFRISHIEIKAPGCKQKRNGAYLQRCVKSIEVNFSINGNLGKKSNSEVQIIAIFKGPAENGEYPTYTTTVNAKSDGAPVIIKLPFNGKQFNFELGIYTVELFYQKQSQQIPLGDGGLTIESGLVIF